ncbi:D-glycerate 3-kinase [Hibiscus syriacus]|uniref:D-glycerate 3-kinase n=1 Tax=Hibiscus syriacus TaxID=106335 RepID=A0A6A2XAX5_HIBSY|nr:D-glycerate 3-kinase [Hibiscus syriacus]
MDRSTLDGNYQQIEHHPLLMERVESHSDRDHIIDITRHDDDASSSSSQDEQYSGVNLTPSEDRPSSISQVPSNATSFSNRLHFGSSSFTRRGDGYGRHRRSPLNSGLWISVEFVFTVCQIIASIVVLILSRNEKPQAPLFAWIVGYTSGCVATLPILYWRFLNRNLGIEQDSTHSHQSSSRDNPSGTTPYTAISVAQASDEENNHIIDSTTTNTPVTRTLSTRLNGLADHFKMALDCFFAVWFVVGNLYRICDAVHTMCNHLLLFALHNFCPWLPRGFSPMRGATREIINALPTFKFKAKKTGNVNNDQENPAGEGGVIGMGTAKERVISGEDAVCCICLTKFADDDELRELPCTHVFHVDCVDKWLKINASCPLCKTDVGESSSGSQ